MQDKLKAFISGASRMPALPTQIGRLFSTIDDPGRSAEDIGRIISADTILSAKVLKLANSVFYSRLEAVTAVSQAIVRLGHKTIRSLILTVWTQTLRNYAERKEELEFLTRLLNHGTAAGIATGMIIRQTNRSIEEDCFVAGLLHDMGRVALVTQLGEYYNNHILATAVTGKSKIIESEKQVLGFHHGDLGAELMRSWHLPDMHINTAAHHHDDDVDPLVNPVVAATTLADEIVTCMGHNIAPQLPRSNREQLTDFFKITDMDSFMENCQTRYDSMAMALDDM